MICNSKHFTHLKMFKLTLLQYKMWLFAFLVLILIPDFVHGQNEKNKPAERNIEIDFANVKGKLNTFFKECVGAGRANEGLRADWQHQLSYAHTECGFKYIRMHGLLTDDMAVYREDKDGNPQYNFMYVDVLFDYLNKIGMKPFVELGFMPSGLASGNQTIFWWRGNVTPPKNYEKWKALVSKLVEHFTERYGVEEVKTWYFEVWNEPNLNGFWAGTQEEYFKLYKFSAEAVKGINPLYRVGGPGTAGAAWEKELIDYCVDNKVPIDFISTHTYGVKQGYLDEFGNSGTVLSKDSMAVSGDVIQSRKEIQDSKKPNLELHYTEWSASYTPADPIHDSYHEASYVLQKLKEANNAAQSMSYWVFTDIFEEAGPRFTPFHGGFGLLTTQGINKPVFYAYKFLNQLGPVELLNKDFASHACKDSNGNVQVLLWNFTNTHPGDSVNNQQYYIRDLPAKSAGKVSIHLTNVPPGAYTMEVYRIGYGSNDPYTTYLKMGRPDQLSAEQVNQIKNQNNGSPFYKESVTIRDSKIFTHKLDLKENDVFFIKLNRKLK